MAVATGGPLYLQMDICALDYGFSTLGTRHSARKVIANTTQKRAAGQSVSWVTSSSDPRKSVRTSRGETLASPTTLYSAVMHSAVVPSVFPSDSETC